jgi:uncharacterized lipoprotein YehR (DUF1307 family)
MKKRVFLIVLAVLMIVSLTACGKKGIEGKWKYVSGDAGDLSSFGEGIFITFKGGKVTMELDPKAEGVTAEQKQFIQSLLAMMTISYKIVSDTQLELSISVLGQSQKETVTYKVDGDTLTLEGAIYKRQ